MKFRLRPGFQPEIEFLSMADNLLNHRAHLINLNRIDDKVLRFIAVFLSGLSKTRRSLLNPIVQNIGKTYQHRSRYVSQLQLIHQFFQIDADTVFTRCHHYMTFVIDTKVRSAPTCNVVKLF